MKREWPDWGSKEGACYIHSNSAGKRAPHLCGDADCPGHRIARQLDALDELIEAVGRLDDCLEPAPTVNRVQVKIGHGSAFWHWIGILRSTLTRAKKARE